MSHSCHNAIPPHNSLIYWLVVCAFWLVFPRSPQPRVRVSRFTTFTLDIAHAAITYMQLYLLTNDSIVKHDCRRSDWPDGCWWGTQYGIGWEGALFSERLTRCAFHGRMDAELIIEEYMNIIAGCFWRCVSNTISNPMGCSYWACECKPLGACLDVKVILVEHPDQGCCCQKLCWVPEDLEASERVLTRNDAGTNHPWVDFRSSEDK